MNHDLQTPDDDAHRDPISGEPGAHPVGTGIGAALGGTAAGALAGTVVGPVGTIIGAAIGAVVGGLAGKDVAEVIDPTREDPHMRDHDSDQAGPEDRFGDDDGPAYGFGARARDRYPQRNFDEVEAALSSDWAASRGGTGLSWERARHAARAGWDRTPLTR